MRMKAEKKVIKSRKKISKREKIKQWREKLKGFLTKNKQYKGAYRMNLGQRVIKIAKNELLTEESKLFFGDN